MKRKLGVGVLLGALLGWFDEYPCRLFVLGCGLIGDELLLCSWLGALCGTAFAYVFLRWGKRAYGRTLLTVLLSWIASAGLYRQLFLLDLNVFYRIWFQDPVGRLSAGNAFALFFLLLLMLWYGLHCFLCCCVMAGWRGASCHIGCVEQLFG